MPDEGSADLADRIQRADALLRNCQLCACRCHVDRTRGELGACGVGATSTAYQESFLWGEEEFLTPSYAIFFSGCNFRCAFCYAAPHNLRPQQDSVVAPAAVGARLRALAERPASFSFIGGEPTCHLPAALRIAAVLPPELPMVWNSNFYFTEEAAELLAGLVDVYVADLHFGNDACAAEIAGVSPYFAVITRNLRWARAHGTLIVRLLALPGHIACCLAPSLAWLVAAVPDAQVHLMTDYLPPPACSLPGLGRLLNETETARAQQLVATSGLRQVQ